MPCWLTDYFRYTNFYILCQSKKMLKSDGKSASPVRPIFAFGNKIDLDSFWAICLYLWIPCV